MRVQNLIPVKLSLKFREEIKDQEREFWKQK